MDKRDGNDTQQHIQKIEKAYEVRDMKLVHKLVQSLTKVGKNKGGTIRGIKKGETSRLEPSEIEEEVM